MTNTLKKLQKEFREILIILPRIASKLNARIYLVGGVVRDLILGREVFDLDIVVEPDAIAFAQEFAKLSHKDFRKHHVFGTATVYFGKHKLDFATARKEIYPGWGQLPKVFPSSIKDDLCRRDFTINSLAISLNSQDYGKVIDLYGGLRDLQKGLIRVLHEKSFLEDPTRILRALRFEQRFSFAIEKNTSRLLKQSIEMDVLSLVHPHRLRDELILVFKEKKPSRHIKRVNDLTGYHFIDEGIKLCRHDFRIIARIEESLSFYQKHFVERRKLEEWLLYLAAILIKLEPHRILEFVSSYGLRKGERIRLLCIKNNLKKMRKLNAELKPHEIYSFLNNLSFESILFFYAYYREKKLRKNLKYFLDTLVDVRLLVKGDDLKRLGIKPSRIYGRLLRELLYVKMDKHLSLKEEEAAAARRIFEALVKNK